MLEFYIGNPTNFNNTHGHVLKMNQTSRPGNGAVERRNELKANLVFGGVKN